MEEKSCKMKYKFANKITEPLYEKKKKKKTKPLYETRKM